MFVDGSNAYCTGRGALRATNFILLSNYLLILIILGHNHNLIVTNLIQTFLDLFILLMTKHKKITSRINPQKIQSAVLKPKILNSS